MTPLPESIVLDIIKTEMALIDNTIWIRDQNVDIPNDEGLYVIVGAVDEQVFSNTSSIIPGTVADPDAAGMTEIQEARSRVNIQIDLLSRDIVALQRRWEVLTSLTSLTSVQAQETNSFSIFAIPSAFINTSDTEGGSKINKFSITIAAHAWYRKEKVLTSDGKQYYDNFTTRVDDKDTIDQPNGLIEFEEPTP